MKSIISNIVPKFSNGCCHIIRFALLCTSYFVLHTSYAQTYTVTTTNDSGIGSLRSGIDSANIGFYDVIEFNISPGSSDVDTIKLISELPIITSTVFVNGESESGYFFGSPSVLITGQGALDYGLRIDSGAGSEIRGLTLQDFAANSNVILIQNTSNISITNNVIGGGQYGVSSDNSSHRIQIDSNYIGLDINEGAFPLTNSGTEINGDSNQITNNVIGNSGHSITGDFNYTLIDNNFLGIHPSGTSLPLTIHALVFTGNNNLISNNQIGNAGLLLRIFGDYNIVAENFIGIDEEGNYHGNSLPSILIEAVADSNVISNNIISNSAMDGILISGPYNKISANNIYSNGVANNAISLNSGTGNNNHPSPSILSHTLVGNDLTLNGTATANDSIEIFLSDGGAQNANVYLVSTQADGAGTWSVTLNGSPSFDSLRVNNYIATATDPLGNTSELGNLYTVDVAPCNFVTNTNDSGPGSLREAINCVNLLSGNQEIKFRINQSGPQTINLLTALPDINGVALDTVSIDGVLSNDFPGGNGKAIIRNFGLTVASYIVLNSRDIVFRNCLRAIEGDTIIARNIWVDSCGAGVHNPDGVIGVIDLKLCTFSNGTNPISVVSNSTNTTSFYIDSCHFYNCPGIESGYTNISSITNSVFGIDSSGMTAPITGDGIVFSPSTGPMLIENNVFFSVQNNAINLNGGGQPNAIVRNNLIGIDTAGQSGSIGLDAIFSSMGGVIQVDSNIIGNSNRGIVITNQGTTFGHFSITNNYIGISSSGDSQPITDEGISALGVTGLDIMNNQILNCGTDGVFVNGGNDSIYVLNNTIGNCGGMGVNLSNGINIVKIEGNHIGTNDLGDTLSIIDRAILLGPGTDQVRVSNNSIKNSSSYGIELSSSTNAVISNNTIQNHSLEGVFITNSSNSHTIDSNVISNNGQSGVYISNSSASGSLIYNKIYSNNDFGIYADFGANNISLIKNYIGTDTSLANLGNGQDGVELTNGSSSFYLDSNIIAYNDSSGLVIHNGNNNTRLTQNLIFSNDLKSIDLDLLAGAGNNAKTSPIITSGTLTSGNLTLIGTSTAGDTIEVFRGVDTIAQSVSYLGFVVADGAGDWTYTGIDPLYDSLDENHYVATATDGSANTSEFGNVYSFYAPCNVVTNTNDSGPGSLREAITCANAGTFDMITFNISPTSNDVDTIKVQSRLPAITRDGIVIDGTTESGFDTIVGPRVCLEYDSIQPTVNICGVPVSAFQFDGLYIEANRSTIRGLIFKDFLLGLNFDSTSSSNLIDSNVFISLISSAFSLYSDSNVISNNKLGKDFAAVTYGNGVTYYNASACAGTCGYIYSEVIDLIGDNNQIVNNEFIYNATPTVGLRIEGNNILVQYNAFDSTQWRSAGCGATPSFPATQLNVINSKDVVVQGNSFATSFIDLSISNTENIYVDSNTFDGWEAINANNVDSSTFTNNIAGTTGINGFLLNLDGSNNLIANNTIHKNGSIYFSAPSSVIEISSTSLQNRLINNITTASTQKPVDINTTGNNGVAKPVVTSTWSEDSLVLDVSASVGDAIEVYLSNSGLRNTLELVDRSITDGIGTYQLSIPTGVNFAPFDQNYYLINTSDILGNSSEFTEVTASAPCNIVTNTNDSGLGSLREAITCANAGTFDTITFNISPTSNDVDTIKVQSRLPAITRDGVVIDGSTESGYQDSLPAIVLMYDSTYYETPALPCPAALRFISDRFSGLYINANDIEVKGVFFTEFLHGLEVLGGTDIIVQNNFFDQQLTSSLKINGGNISILNNTIGRPQSISEGNGKYYYWCTGYIPHYTNSQIDIVGDSLFFENNIIENNKALNQIINLDGNYLSFDGNVILDNTDPIKFFNNVDDIRATNFNSIDFTNNYITGNYIISNCNNFNSRGNHVTANSSFMLNEFAVQLDTVGLITINNDSILGFNGIKITDLDSGIIDSSFFQAGSTPFGGASITLEKVSDLEVSNCGLTGSGNITSINSSDLNIHNNSFAPASISILFNNTFDSQVYENYFDSIGMTTYQLNNSNRNVLRNNTIHMTGINSVAFGFGSLISSTNSDSNTYIGNVFPNYQNTTVEPIIHTNANENKVRPDLDHLFIGTDSLRIFGKTSPFDTVEVYLSSSDVKNAILIVGKTAALADSTWEMYINDSNLFNPFIDNFYIAIATDLSGNSTEVSEIDSVLFSLCNLAGMDIIPTDSAACPGTNVILDATIDSMTYSWTSQSTGFTSASKTPTLTATDTYYLEISDGLGCFIYDTSYVHFDNPIAATNFLMADQSGVDEPLIVIDVTFPEPDSTNWIFGAATATPVDYYYELTFADTGAYSIGFVTSLGGCHDTIFKSVSILQDFIGFDGSKSVDFEDQIDKILLFPNPNTGVFTAEITLNDIFDVTVGLYSVNQGGFIQQDQLTDEDFYSLDYNLPNLPTGVYVLYVYSAKDSGAVKIIVD